MFNLPTNIPLPGFRVGQTDDATDQNSQPGLLRVGQPIEGLDQNGLSGFRHGPPDKAGKPVDDTGPPVGGLALGALGAGLGTPIPGLGFLLGYGGFQLGSALQRLHHQGMLDIGNCPSLGVNPVGP